VNKPVITLHRGIETFDYVMQHMWAWGRVKSAIKRGRAGLLQYILVDFNYYIDPDKITMFELGPLLGLEGKELPMRLYSGSAPIMQLRIGQKAPALTVLEYIEKHPEEREDLMKKFDLCEESLDG